MMLLVARFNARPFPTLLGGYGGDDVFEPLLLLLLLLLLLDGRM